MIEQNTNNWKESKVLITGADGFIGSHLSELLVASGAQVTALALYNSFDSNGWLDDIAKPIRSEINIVRGDVRDAHQMITLARGQDVIFHLAALIAIPYSYEAPGSYVRTNVEGTLNVLNAALNAGVSKFIHTSTSEVYGTAQFQPITEEHSLQGQSPYSASKIGSDMMVEAYGRSFGLPAVILRPFNTFGPRQSERAVISTIIRQVLDDRCESLRLGDLTPTRDFNYVEDTASAFLHAALIDEEHHGGAFNAGTGRMISIGELVELIQGIAETDKPVLQEERRVRPSNSEVYTLISDSSKLSSLSGWTPRVDFVSGLTRTIEWWRKRIDFVRDDAEYMV